MYIKGGDLLVVQDHLDGEVKSYSGLQLVEDMRQLMGEGVQIWTQGSPPPTEGGPDYVTSYDLWFDTSVAAFFIASKNDAQELTWIIVNPADHKDVLKNTSQTEYFPPSGAVDGDVWEHPGSKVKYYFRAVSNQWCDATGAGENEFVLLAGDTMTGNLELPQLIVTGDDTVDALIEINEGILTADDSVAGEEQRLYWNGDTIAKHEDVVTLANSVINIDQHIENITPYTYRGLLRNSTSNDPESYVFYDSMGGVTSDIELAEKVFLSDTGVGIDGIDVTQITNGMYLEVQRVDATDVLTGKIIEKSSVTGGAEFNLDVTRAQGTATVGDISHVRIFSVADSSAKAGVYYQLLAPDKDAELLKPGQLWVDSSTNIQYIWTGEEWTEVGAACGSGGSTTVIPVGTIWPYAGDISGQNPVPRGWLLCDGSNIDGRYVRLKALLGADNVPDLRGKYLGGAEALGLDGVRSEKTDFTRRPRLTEDFNGQNGNNNAILFNGNVGEKDLGNHTHGKGNLTAYTSGDDGNHSHKFSAATYNKTGGTHALRNEQGNDYTSPKQGSHNHSITMAGDTGNSSWNSNKHSHNVNFAYKDWDQYTRPYTYVVHWIIKHD